MTGLLLDTHVLLWANAAPERLGRNTVAEITQIGSNLFVSAVTVAEIAIKRSIGKLRMTLAISDLLAPLDARELALSMAHAEALERLPMLHRDPFDRLLAAQASCDGLTLVTADDRLLAYPVATLDART
ncbi:MAG TPA: type II toxin-antitoxin system VapC family toxin [Microthrixaceae bacterium]|nr:type II toxin-antitoxin system VapC family toxin [Microthrixaceae bacterium]HNI35985.1 type II toxin-antitoxin system VapC family toxin [Microthrixaceae bacterium]